MNFKTSTSLCLLAGSMLLTTNSFAGAKMALSDDSAIEFGGSIRAELVSQEDGAAEGDSLGMNLHSMRFYLKGKVTDNIAFQLQTEHKGGPMVMLDTLAKFKVSDSVNVWAGRFIPPSDRSNLSGSYNLPTWQYPGVASKYPIPQKGGRDDGIAVMGSTAEGRLSYSFGMFNGKQASTVPTDSESFSGRLAYSFWDKEGYMTKGTYFGKKDILTIGLTTMQQADAFGDDTATTDFSAYNLDFLLEKNLESGALASVEAAIYDYDQYGGNVAKEGDAYFVALSYMLPGKYGAGRLQPSVRYQSFSPADATVEDTTRFDIGVTSVIRGHGARIGLFYGVQDTAGAGDVSVVKVGLQLKL